MAICKRCGKDTEDLKTATCFTAISNTMNIQHYHESLIQKLKQKDVQFVMSSPEQPIIKTVIVKPITIGIGE